MMFSFVFCSIFLLLWLHSALFCSGGRGCAFCNIYLPLTKFEFRHKTNYRLVTVEPGENTFPDEVLLRMKWFNLGSEPTGFKGNTLPF